MPKDADELSRDPADIANHLERMCIQLKGIQAGDSYGDDRVTRSMIVERLSFSGLYKEADDLKPSVGKSYQSGPPRGDQSFIDKVQGIIHGLRTEPAIWKRRIADGLKRSAELEARRHVTKTGNEYVSPLRIEDLRAVSRKRKRKKPVDVARLIRLCEELNVAHQNECFLTIAMLVRTIANHVPPIFGPTFTKFSEVANNYGGDAFKKSMNGMSEFRPIGNIAVHTPIRAKESLTTFQQVDVRAASISCWR